jgi:hypothetical protein
MMAALSMSLGFAFLENNVGNAGKGVCLDNDPTLIGKGAEPVG